MIKLTETETTIELEFPYYQEMIEKCRNLNGTFSSNKWIFEKDEDILSALKLEVKKVFNFDIEAEKTKAYITVKDDIYEGKASVIFNGFALSIARGRDSGAKTEKGVVLLGGKIFSAGSAKNWSSEIEAGSRFMIKDFPVNVESTEFFEVEYAEVEEENTEDSEVTAMIARLENLGYIVTKDTDKINER